MFRLREVEVVYRSRAVEGAPGKASVPLICAERVHDLMHGWAALRAHESFWMLCLDSRSKLLGVHEVARGGVGFVSVELASVFRAAVVMSAKHVIVVHNHPSDEATPSKEDMDVTNRLCAAAELLDIGVLDHVIICQSGFFSFLENGLMPEVKRHG
jgi:DNA repair protein RadC